MPYYLVPDRDGGHQYSRVTDWEKLVADYCRISIMDVYNLPLIEYLTYRRDAFIALLNRSESGQEYLDNAWRCEQTEPERTKLRDKFGGEKHGK